MSLSSEQISSAMDEAAELSLAERIAQIRRTNLEADELMAEANRIFAARRLKDSKRGDWVIVPVGLAFMLVGGAVVAFGMLIAWALK